MFRDMEDYYTQCDLCQVVIRRSPDPAEKLKFAERMLMLAHHLRKEPVGEFTLSLAAHILCMFHNRTPVKGSVPLNTDLLRERLIRRVYEYNPSGGIWAARSDLEVFERLVK